MMKSFKNRVPRVRYAATNFLDHTQHPWLAVLGVKTKTATHFVWVAVLNIEYYLPSAALVDAAVGPILLR